jgi:hypothetical protein
MVGILKIQLGRLRVFSCFLFFEMSFEAFFMRGLVCIEVEFKLIQFTMQLGVFFFFPHTKRMGEERGLERKNVILKLQFVIKK